MKRFLFFLLTLILPAIAQAQEATDPAPLSADAVYVRIITSMGDIDVALDPVNAPITTENFLAYVDQGYYGRLIFHRVVADTIVQGGGYTARLNPRATRAPIPNEATNGLSNTRGTIAMARFLNPDSATSQFFINLKDNSYLDREGEVLHTEAGYAVFGRVVAGLDVADAISRVPTGEGEGREIYFEANVPLEPVLIQTIERITLNEITVTP